MSLDFRSGQVRNNKLISSGSTGTNAKFLVYDVAAASDTAGGISTSVFSTGSIGSDVFVFVSGGIGSRGVGSTNATTVFGGDVYISGVLSGANINALSSSFNTVYVRRDGSSPMTANWNIGETSFLAAGAYGVIYNGGTKRFFVSHSAGGQLRVFEHDSSNNWVFGETNGTYVSRTALVGPTVEISAGTLGNYHLYVYSTGGVVVGLETDPGAGNLGLGAAHGIYVYNNSSQFTLLGGNISGTDDFQYGDSKARGLSFQTSSSLGYNEVARFQLGKVGTYFSGSVTFVSSVLATGPLVVGKNPDGQGSSTGTGSIQGADRTGTNIIGGDLLIASGRGTGNARSSFISISASFPGGTGTAQHRYIEIGQFVWDTPNNGGAFILGSGEETPLVNSGSNGFAILRGANILSGTAHGVGGNINIAVGTGTGTGSLTAINLYGVVSASSLTPQSLTQVAQFGTDQVSSNPGTTFFTRTTVSGSFRVSGSQHVVTRIISGSDTINSTDYAVFVHSGSTVTLPAASINPGRVLILYCALGKQFISGAGITLTPNGTDAINDNAVSTSVTASYGRAFSLISLGSESRWYSPEL